MSYDLLVFEPSAAPRERNAFAAWWNKTAEWGEGHSYDDPGVTTERLRAWYQQIEAKWPCLNGPGFQEENLDSPRLTDYSIGKDAIYAGFRWSLAEEAYEDVRRLAVKHAVGFYDVSGDEGDGEIYFPGDTLRPASQGAWRQVAQQFRDLEENQ